MAEPGIADPVAAPEPAPAPAPAPVVPEGTVYDSNTHVLVPKEQLGDYDGRFGNVMRDAKAYAAGKADGRYDPGMDKILDLARQNGMTLDQVHDYITSDGSVGGQPQQNQYDIPGQPPAGQQPPEALTVNRYQELRQQERAEDTAARQAEAADTQRATAFNSEREDVTKMLRDDFKYSFTEDGLPDGSRAIVAQQLFNSALNKVMKGDVPDWLPQEDRVKALSSIVSTPSTSSQRQKAKTLFTEWVTEFKNDAVAEFAEGQKSVPATTLGTGAGGPVTKDVKDMSPAEERAELDRRVHARTGKHMDPMYEG